MHKWRFILHSIIVAVQKRAADRQPVKVSIQKLNAIALFKAVYASAGINKLLPARVERMALGTNFNF